MKKYFVVLFLMSIFLTATAFAGEYQPTKLIQANWGSGDGEFGLMLEAEGNCPQSLTVDEQGNLAIIDAANRRVQLYSSEGKWNGKFVITSQAFDIQSDKEKIILLAPYDHLIELYNRDGKMIERIQLNQKIDLIHGLRISDRKIFVQTVEQVQYQIEEKSLAKQIPSIEQGVSARQPDLRLRTQWQNPQHGFLMIENKRTNKKQTIDVTSSNELGSLIFLDTDEAGNIYVRKELFAAENQSYFEVDKFDPDGNLLNTIRIPNENIVSPFKPITVDRDGNVYFLEIKAEGFGVIQWEER